MEINKIWKLHILNPLIRREVCLLFNVKTNLGNQVERINLLKRLSLKKGSPQLSCLLNINRISAIPWLRLYILGIEYLGTTSINYFCKDTDTLALLLSSNSQKKSPNDQWKDSKIIFWNLNFSNFSKSNIKSNFIS